jgi:hypothetical protein
LPFSEKPPPNNVETEDILFAVSAREVAGRIGRLKKNTASGPDGVQRKNLMRKDVKVALEYL